jgi:hypothetical protein
MKTTGHISLVLLICLICISELFSQQEVTWLSDYKSDMNTGSYSYKYTFQTVDNKPCKLNIEENKTDKKANTISASYLFYLSDLETSKLAYKPSGSAIIITLATKSAQKLISVYKNDALEEYTNSFTMTFDAVDKARSFIDAIKEHNIECNSSETSWSNANEAFGWLSAHIKESSNSGTTNKQSFQKGDKEYIALFTQESVDSKGMSNKKEYSFNLNDIYPQGVLLEISGKTLKVVVPVKENKNFIQVRKDGQSSYTNEFEIYSDNLEEARIIISALSNLTTNAKVTRKEWGNYSEALGFVKSNLKELNVGTSKVSYELNYSTSTSDKIVLKTIDMDSKGVQTDEINQFYFIDLNPIVEIEVTSKNVSLNLRTKEKTKYIKQISKEKTTGYASEAKLYLDNIELARDVMTALEYSVKSGTEGIIEFSTIEKAIDWLIKVPGDVNIDTKAFHQSIQIDRSSENQLDLNVITTDASGASVNERFEIYPEDISKENLKLKISGKKLFVPVSTGKNKYIKAFKGDAQQNYSDEIEFLFEDILTAKNFIKAVAVIQEKSVVTDRSISNRNVALSYLTENIKAIMIDSKIIEQKITELESKNCKFEYSTSETDSKGVAVTNNCEFILSDIDFSKSAIVIDSKQLKINLVTKEKQKLIKTTKNGEPGNFIYNVEIYAEDILQAKKILSAFQSISAGCK